MERRYAPGLTLTPDGLVVCDRPVTWWSVARARHDAARREWSLTLLDGSCVVVRGAGLSDADWSSLHRTVWSSLSLVHVDLAET